MKQHHFDIEHAARFGVYEAVVINHFQWWIFNNRANGTHFHDGRTWSYNSVEALRKTFPYWKPDQIRRTLERLVKAGVLIKGMYSANLNRSTWYAFVDEAEFLGSEESHLANKPNRASIRQKSQMSSANMPDEFGKNAECSIYTDKNASENTDKSKGAAAPSSSYSARVHLQEIGVDQQIASDWLQVRKDKKAAATKTAIDGVLREIERAGMTPDAGLRICCERGWAGFKGEWVTPTRQQQPQAAANSQLGPAGQATAAAAQRLIQSVLRESNGTN